VRMNAVYTGVTHHFTERISEVKHGRDLMALKNVPQCSLRMTSSVAAELLSSPIPIDEEAPWLEPYFDLSGWPP